MPGRPNNTPIIAGIVLLAIGGIVGLNIMQQKNDPTLQEKIAKDQEQEARKNQKNTPVTPPSAPETPGASEVVTWGAEKVLGKPGGSPTITVGWAWTPALQGDPGSVYTAVDMMQKTLPSAAIRVVNLDAKPGAVPSGIAVGGAVKMAAMPDGTFPPAMAMSGMLKSLTTPK